MGSALTEEARNAISEIILGVETEPAPDGTVDPVTFATHTQFLNLTLYDWQRDILRSLFDGTPQDICLVESCQFCDPESEDNIAPDADRLNELVVIAGMRSGKTFLAGIIVAYLVYRHLMLDNPWKHYDLAPGSKFDIACVATSRRQARETIFAAFKGVLAGSPWFQAMEKAQTMEVYKNDVLFPRQRFAVHAIASNSASAVGNTLVAAVFDELSRSEDTHGRRGGHEVYEGLSKGTKTLDGWKITITSPLFEKDMGMKLLADAWESPRMLGFHAPTWDLNPRFDRAEFDEEFRRNPEMAMRDFGAQPSSAIEPFFRRPKKIDAMFTTAIRRPVRGNERVAVLAEDFKGEHRVRYFLAGDPALRNDAFGVAMCHRDPDTKRGVADLVYRFKPDPKKQIEVSAEEVFRLFATLIARFNVAVVRFDTWMFPETIQKLRKLGTRVQVEQHIVGINEYQALKEAIYDDRLVTYPHSTLRSELRELELINGRKVDHPSKGSKDVADALANAYGAMISWEQDNKGSVYHFATAQI